MQGGGGVAVRGGQIPLRKIPGEMRKVAGNYAQQAGKLRCRNQTTQGLKEQYLLQRWP